MNINTQKPQKSQDESVYPQHNVIQGVIQPSTFAELDRAIALLRSKKDTWCRTSLRDKIDLIDSVIDRYYSLSEKWVEVSLHHKRADRDTYALGWEWATGPMPILRFLSGLKHTLKVIDETGNSPSPVSINTLSNGQVSVKVYPSNLYERISTPGTTIDVWMEPGLSAQEVLNEQLNHYKQTESKTKLCLVLGAGNISGIPVNDSLSKLFLENCVVLLKMNPVNAYLGALIEDAFQQLISKGYFNVVYGDATEGSYLCNHADIDCIHMTGSDNTYETIVFGSGEEGLQCKQEHHPICEKPITAELGNIAPAIIVPGPWSDHELKYQAEHIASHLCDSGSYSCNRTRVILQQTHWELRKNLLKELREVLRSIPPRAAYYPHAEEQYDKFLSTHPEAQVCGNRMEGILPWTLIPGVDPQDEDEICFTLESFCPIIAETSIDGSSVADFIMRAVEFANQRLWGNLSASIIVHPLSLRDPDVSEAIEWAIDELRYGIISVNCLPGLAWGLTIPPWGSFPGNVPWDIQSGVGFVHNLHMFSRPQKTILRGAFQTRPRPPWFPSQAAKMGEICKRVTRYEANPSLYRMLSIFVSAIG
jgi:acyl-CoA reductase-like NAD-dependent aldehyde dehydrogenase